MYNGITFRSKNTHEHIMKIPEPIRELFDRFPLRKYPASTDQALIKSDVYFFEAGNLQTSFEENFSLAVHNVKLIDMGGNNKKCIATDPESLSASLILCEKHGLLLPRKNSRNKSKHCMIPLSYLASPDNELPILIESTKKMNTSINMCKEIREIIFDSGTANSQEIILNSYLNNLQDLWILTLLADMPCEDSTAYIELFARDSETYSNEMVNFFITMKLVKDIPFWNDFIHRYPHLFRASPFPRNNWTVMSKMSIVELFSMIDTVALQRTYFTRVEEFEKFIVLFMDFLQTSESTSGKRILELKFASFVVCVSHVLPESTLLSQVLQRKHRNAIEYSESVLENF